MLPKTYRFVAKNETGQNLVAAKVVVKAVRKKFDSTGALTFDGETTEYSNSGTIANNSFGIGANRDNSTDKWLAADCVATVDAPASSVGNVILFLQHSTDGGTTWPDDSLGRQVCVINFTTAAIKRRSFKI